MKSYTQERRKKKGFLKSHALFILSFFFFAQILYRFNSFFLFFEFPIMVLYPLNSSMYINRRVIGNLQHEGIIKGICFFVEHRKEKKKEGKNVCHIQQERFVCLFRSQQHNLFMMNRGCNIFLLPKCQWF